MQVRAAFKAGITPSRIARQFGLSQSDVRKALAGDEPTSKSYGYAKKREKKKSGRFRRIKELGGGDFLKSCTERPLVTVPEETRSPSSNRVSPVQKLHKAEFAEESLT